MDEQQEIPEQKKPEGNGHAANGNGKPLDPNYIIGSKSAAIKGKQAKDRPGRKGTKKGVMPKFLVVHDRNMFSEEEVTRALIACEGYVYSSANYLGIAAATMAKYIKEYKLQHLRQDYKRKRCEDVEKKLFERGVKDGDVTALIHWTKYFKDMEKFGWGPPPKEIKHEHQHTVKFKPVEVYSEEEQKKRLELLEQKELKELPDTQIVIDQVPSQSTESVEGVSHATSEEKETAARADGQPEAGRAADTENTPQQ